MQNFNFHWATKVHFGKDVLRALPEEVLRYGRTVFFVYGEHSAKRSGGYDLVHRLCEEQGIRVIDFTGIEPNPRHSTVDQAVAMIKAEKPDCLLAMGGGSIIDSVKAMSIAAFHEGSCWDFYEGKAVAKQALPILTIPTLAASGAEVSNVSVISNHDLNRKWHYRTDLERPAVVFADPTYTMTTPPFQTACGIIDAMSHIYEGYFSFSTGSVQDGISEGIQKACIEHGLRLMDDPSDYESRAQLLWASELTITHLADCGRNFIGAVHALESALSGYLNLTHGAGIAICTRAWLHYALCEETAPRIAQWGRNVWGLQAGASSAVISQGGREEENASSMQQTMREAEAAIEAYENFMRRLDLPLTLTELKGEIPEETLQAAAERVCAVNDVSQWFRPMQDPEDVREVFALACREH